MNPINDTLPSNNENKKIAKLTLVEENIKDNNTKKHRCKKCKKFIFLQGYLAITNVFLMTLVFLFCWGVMGDIALPGGHIFTLILIFSTSYVSGAIASMVNLPDLFGMLISGIVLRNVPILKIDQSLDHNWSSFLRGSALAIILVRAGMGLDPDNLKPLSCSILRLAFSPCFVEMCITGVTSHFLLGLPWNYAFILGSVLSAVSPGIVVPSLLNLSEMGYGVEKGIPTLVIAASSIDDVLAISMFGVLIGITFAEGNILFIALKSPMEIVLGACYGMVFGSLLWVIPHAQHKHKMLLRFILLLLSALVGLNTSIRIGFGGAGPFTALILGFVVQMGWRKETLNEKESVSNYFEIVWAISKPFLFGLTGAEVSFSNLELNLVGTGVITLFIGLAFRMATTFVVISGNKLTINEKIFIVIAWLPKATVQATIGGVALDIIRKKGGTDDEIQIGLKIVSIAVLSILVTAPLGSILITNLGPILLTKATRVVTPPLSIPGTPTDKETQV